MLWVTPLCLLCRCCGRMRKVWQHSCTIYNCQFNNHWWLQPRLTNTWQWFLGQAGKMTPLWVWVVCWCEYSSTHCIPWLHNTLCIYGTGLISIIQYFMAEILSYRVTQAYTRFLSIVAKVGLTKRRKVVCWGWFPCIYIMSTYYMRPYHSISVILINKWDQNWLSYSVAIKDHSYAL